jgi:predicted NAD-dependent protein-ADP-ribosyltransferase YbiA (DUF1768 family)
MKFTDEPEYMEAIRKASNPTVAKKMGSSRSHKLREDWDGY